MNAAPSTKTKTGTKKTTIDERVMRTAETKLPNGSSLPCLRRANLCQFDTVRHQPIWPCYDAETTFRGQRLHEAHHQKLYALEQSGDQTVMWSLLRKKI